MTTPYEALDSRGLPYMREARTVHELPTPADRLDALRKITPHVEQLLGLRGHNATLSFGRLIFSDFGFASARAVKGLPHEKILLTRGQDLPLTLLYEP